MHHVSLLTALVMEFLWQTSSARPAFLCHLGWLPNHQLFTMTQNRPKVGKVISSQEGQRNAEFSKNLWKSVLKYLP